MTKGEYKSFISQSRECRVKGIRKEIENKYSNFPSKLLICTKYWECCSSRVCFQERYKPRGDNKMICTCKDWKESIKEIDGAFVLQAIRGGSVYNGQPFKYCPWCGNTLKEERRTQQVDWFGENKRKA